MLVWRRRPRRWLFLQVLLRSMPRSKIFGTSGNVAMTMIASRYYNNSEVTRGARYLAGPARLLPARLGLVVELGAFLDFSLPCRLSATAARISSFNAASLIVSPSWISIARLTFPSRLELNRPEGSASAAPLANVIFTTFLYVSPVQTMPPCDHTGTPGDVAFAHFHSSTISGSALWMISRSFLSVFPRQSSAPEESSL